MQLDDTSGAAPSERDSIATLTERERSCLRHVLMGLTSSEIGRELSLAPTTVDKLVKTAVRKLGARDRRHAARLHAAFEAGVQHLDPQTADLSGRNPFGIPLPVATSGRPINDLSIKERLLSIVGLAFVIGFAAVGVLAVSSTIHRIFGQAAHTLDRLLH